MLYRFVRTMVRLSLHFYCKRIGWEGEENIPFGKPILFAPTHSNSFLDALFVASAFHRSVYCLARGDAFRKPSMNKILRHCRLLPVYRQSENDDNAGIKNRETFEECQALFKKNQWVLIFPEGFCTYQTEVLPLKKGFVMMAQKAWAADIDLHIVPVSITYNNFTKWGKRCDVIFGKPITKSDMLEGKTTLSRRLTERLYNALSENFPSPLQFKGKNLLWSWVGQLMYYLGWLVQFPAYGVCAYIAKKKTEGTVFYDSVVVALLCFILPIYYILIFIIISFLR